ncbi:hypothetical protein TCAL_02802 [Tigriopus californicus]|uniref:Uncharacterized protein n=1 Tax=Tigriopus californicus TaxID=6832 RepID=A0A553NYS9_TIGCA|nr:uncharacterized protein LOC131887147 isoform X2 [Tigriopus californicus]TRY70587.1 hypothetical protein TCAL_02802 [Tigriopus californicus]
MYGPWVPDGHSPRLDPVTPDSKVRSRLSFVPCPVDGFCLGLSPRWMMSSTELMSRLGSKPQIDLQLLFELVQKVGLEREANMSRKKALWIQVANRYNAYFGDELADELYNANSCRRAWNNLKVRTRKKYSDLLKEHGPADGEEPRFKLDQFSMRILAETGDKPEFWPKITESSSSDKTNDLTSTMRQHRIDKKRHETVLWLQDDSFTPGFSSSGDDESSRNEEAHVKQINILNDKRGGRQSQPRQTPSSSCFQEDFYSSHDSNDSLASHKSDPIQVFNSSRGNNSMKSEEKLPSTSPHGYRSTHSRVRRSKNEGKRARLSILPYESEESQTRVESKLKIEEYHMKRQILRIDRDTAEIQRRAAEAKLIREQKLFEIEKKKLTDLSLMEVSAAKYRARKERALALKAERDLGIESPSSDELMLDQ